MPSTDDRIVAMRFDGAAFEKKIADVILSLDKLKASLDFTSAAKSMENINEASKAVDFHHMSESIHHIAEKFTWMGVVAFTALSNIVNRAVDAGMQLAKSLSFGSMLSGFGEYETNMNSIQTILSNTRSDATTLEDVNEALDVLNEYSDKTIYNFSQMAKNIGTFTAAGVSLEESTGAIKGIANLAAVSGSSAEQASSAMYQLSQALATGTLKLIDWNSVVNAGMGGEVFKKALFETGKAMGTLKDVPLDQTFEEWEAAGNKFRDTLEQGWITGEVLTNTLAGFTGDMTEAQLTAIGYTKEQAQEIMAMGEDAKQAATKVKTFTQLMGTLKESVGSGWAQTFRTIFGDFEEARSLFTGLNDFFGGFLQKSAESRNETLQVWKDLGGRNILLQSLMYALNDLVKVMTPIRDAFRDVFPEKGATQLYSMTVRLREFFKELEPTKQQIEAIKTVFTGLFSAIHIGWTIFKELISSIKEVVTTLYDRFFGKSEGMLSGLAGFAEKIIALRESLVKGGGIEEFFDKWTAAVINFVDKATGKFIEVRGQIDKIKAAFSIGEAGQELFNMPWLTGMETFANKLGLAVNDAKDWLEKFKKAVEDNDVSGKIEEAAEKIKGWFDTVKGFFSDTDIPGEMSKVQGSFDTAGGAVGKLKDMFGDLKEEFSRLVE